jgi:hypothetical protein
MVFLIKYTALLILFFLTLNSPAQAKSHLHKLPTDTQEDLALIKRVADNPDLLNPKYLECYLGPKASTMIARSSKSLRSPAPVSRTFWLDRDGSSIHYTFEQSILNLNKFLAEFSFAPNRQEDLTFEDVSKVLNKEPIRAFDENAQPAFLYTINPNIKIFAYQDAHVINLSRVALQYAGPSLPLPSATDMAEAIKHRRDAALQHASLGHHDKASSLLRSHLAANPTDAEAHLKLAQSYQARSYVNDAIREYKIALATCGNDKDIHDHCLEGLHSLKVDLPSPASPVNTNMVPARININPEPKRTPLPNLNSTTGQKNKPLDVGF